MLKRFLKEEKGQSMVEYILIIAVIAAIVIAVMGVLRNALTKKAESVAEDIGNAGADSGN